jgi:hypothetical protein
MRIASIIHPSLSHHVFLSIALAVGAGSLSAAPPPRALRVLFIGNSYTAANNLSNLFADLSRSGGHEVSVDAVVEGGWTLAQHAASQRALGKIGQEKWDYVVLQEQSVTPSVEAGRRQMYPAVRLLDERIRRSGARTVLYMTWGRRDGFPELGFHDCTRMQAELTAGYMNIADELHLTVAPVGIAWQSALARDRRLNLWQGDGSHPTLQGSYLAACVFYAAVFRKTPEGLAFTAGLPGDVARSLQAAAGKTVLENPDRWHL